VTAFLRRTGWATRDRKYGWHFRKAADHPRDQWRGGVNALIMPKLGATNAPDSTQDQIYSVLAEGNAAKLGQPLPV
jgi:hypothetical protein